ncbi:dihydroneopterin aldolase [Candidatus Neomarinimicrobiota bacterium]
MDIIRLNNVTLFARHGVAPQEQELGQRFTLNIELVADLTTAAKSDELSDAMDYAAVLHTVTAAFTGRACNLLEHAAWNVVRVLFKEFPAEEIRIRVRKSGAGIDSTLESAEVELIKKRQEVLDD